MSNFIGKGESTSISILKMLLNLSNKSWQDGFNKVGLYEQVPLPLLLTKEDNQDLSELHTQSSVDIVLITQKEKIAVYVNHKDHAGAVKSQRDSVRYDMLMRNGFKVVRLSIHECAELFKEKYNYKSIWEVCNALVTAKVKL